MMRHRLFLFVILIQSAFLVEAQTSDSTMVAHLRTRGVNITDGNSVKLLRTGHEKFEDLFDEKGNLK